MPTRTPHQKTRHRVPPKAPVILVVVEGGAVKDVILHNAVGHVFVADKDILAPLTPEQREAAIVLGSASRTLGHTLFEAELASLIEGTAPAVTAPASDPEPTPVSEPATPVADPTAATAVALNATLTPGTVENAAVVATVTTPVAAPATEDTPTAPIPNPAANPSA